MGGLGKLFEFGFGVEILKMLLRVLSIKIVGMGGKISKLENLNISIGIDILIDSIFDINLNNDDFGLIYIFD